MGSGSRRICAKGARRAGPFRLLGERSAQGTLEYALVVCALLALVTGLAAIWKAGDEGLFARLVEDAASHGLDPWGLVDIILY